MKGVVGSREEARSGVLLPRDSRVSFQRDTVWHFNALFQPAKSLICKTRSRSGHSFAISVSVSFPVSLFLFPPLFAPRSFISSTRTLVSPCCCCYCCYCRWLCEQIAFLWHRSSWFLFAFKTTWRSSSVTFLLMDEYFFSQCFHRGYTYFNK